MFAQITDHLFSIDTDPEFSILLQHFERGAKLLTMTMDQIL